MPPPAKPATKPAAAAPPVGESSPAPRPSPKDTAAEAAEEAKSQAPEESAAAAPRVEPKPAEPARVEPEPTKPARAEPQPAEPEPVETALAEPEPVKPMEIAPPPAARAEPEPPPAVEPEPAPAAKAPVEAEPAEPVPEVAPLPEETKEAALSIPDTMDIGIAGVRDFDSEKCFFAAVTTVSDTSLDIKGFGLTAAPFERLYNALKEKSPVEPEINGHLITDAQCAATDFLKSIQRNARNNPSLTLAEDNLALGDNLVATVDRQELKRLDMLLVDSDGFVYNVDSYANKMTDGNRDTFEMKVDRQGLRNESPEMVIAITSDDGIGLPEGKTVTRAADLLPKLARRIESLPGGSV